MEIVEVNLQGLAEWNVDPIITVRVRWIVVWISGTNKSVVLHISTRRTFNKIKIILKRTPVTYDDDDDDDDDDNDDDDDKNNDDDNIA